jgi:hypothetical protein
MSDVTASHEFRVKTGSILSDYSTIDTWNSKMVCIKSRQYRVDSNAGWRETSGITSKFS